MRKPLLEFEIAIAQAEKDPNRPQPACVGHSDEFVDYEPEDVPDEETAALLCERCPLLALCYKSATKSKPEWGVWGGVAWYQGKQLRWLERFGYLDTESFMNQA